MNPLRLLDFSWDTVSAGGLFSGVSLPWMSHLTVANLTLGLGLPEQSVLQPTWNYLLQHHQAELRSPLFPVVISVSTYLLLVTLYTLLDLLAPSWPALNSYKLHPDRPVTWDNIWTTLYLTAYNHLVYIFPAAVGQWLWRPPIPLPRDAPTLMSFLLGILGCMVVFDFQFYLWHLLHHRVPWLYRTFHAMHHQYLQPFSLVTQYVSAWELISSGFWTTVDPLLLQCHCLTAWGFMVFTICVSTEDHCGYDFPWSLHRLVPFGLWGGPPKHDAHHRMPGTNFAPFFSHWDWLGGTNMVPTPSKDKYVEEGLKGRKDKGA
ncbi:cholesterol 25-hydroxylase-like protein 2 [Oncorhynchus keta]|uniref:cholesterol 25-hydroxylase-like protein 2 n=1 Tax=Oncorhynchus keta TaxID=8018 RepID=UPI0015FBFFB3|nr:cholesterol 25-hydroxylase-like protein 2 [Oncorhynchus keta]